MVSRGDSFALDVCDQSSLYVHDTNGRESLSVLIRQIYNAILIDGSAHDLRTLALYRSHRLRKAGLLVEGQRRVSLIVLRGGWAAWRGEMRRQRAKLQLRNLMWDWRRQRVLRKSIVGETTLRP